MKKVFCLVCMVACLTMFCGGAFAVTPRMLSCPVCGNHVSIVSDVPDPDTPEIKIHTRWHEEMQHSCWYEEARYVMTLKCTFVSCGYQWTEKYWKVVYVACPDPDEV